MNRYKFLRMLILGAGLTQSDMARQAGLTEKHISRLCNGQAGISEITAEKIADVLGLPEELLYVGMYLETLALERGDLVLVEDTDEESE